MLPGARTITAEARAAARVQRAHISTIINEPKTGYYIFSKRKFICIISRQQCSRAREKGACVDFAYICALGKIHKFAAQLHEYYMVESVYIL